MNEDQFMDYMERARRTARYQDDLGGLLYCGAGFVSELIEYTTLPAGDEKTLEEIGDMLWYATNFVYMAEKLTQAKWRDIFLNGLATSAPMEMREFVEVLGHVMPKAYLQMLNQSRSASRPGSRLAWYTLDEITNSMGLAIGEALREYKSETGIQVSLWQIALSNLEKLEKRNSNNTIIERGE